MDIFDDTIREIQKWFQGKRNSGQARQYDVSAFLETTRNPVGIPGRTGTNPAIILKEDTHLELGHPSVGSCSATLATHDPSFVENGRVTLVGPEISETGEEMLPFAQVAIACCTGDIEDASATMDRVMHFSAPAEGYMLRSVPNLIWARVSKEAVRAGFSIRELGLRLMTALGNECTDIISSEIFFVTSNREDVSAIAAIVDPAREKLRKLKTFGRNPDGTYECDTSLDCNECPEKPVCDTIREVITIRKGDRIIRLGNDPEKEVE